MNNPLQLLSSLREVMEADNIDAYIIPSTDPHLGENIPDHWRIIPWLTGFTGSSANVVITDSFAGLWTDSRYFVQAENQLGNSGYTLIKPVLPGKKDYTGWIKENIKPGGTVALDGRIFSLSGLRKLEDSLKGLNVQVVIDFDPISTLWTDRPPLSDSKAFEHPVAFSGLDRTAKISIVREKMRIMGVEYHLLTSIDDIMWMLNIRGRDVNYTPLLTSYAIVVAKQILLFVDENKIPLKLASEFDNLDIVILPYEETAGMLSVLPADSSILITPSTTSAVLYRSIPEGMKITEDISIPSVLKAIKNKTEIENIGRVMIKDGVALTRFFFWLDQNTGNQDVSELSVAAKLHDMRLEQENFLSPSFKTISAYNEHGALPHYSATPETDCPIGTKGILLVDSGGQYLDGTTDITRTVAIGTPTAAQKRDFTLVLKGTINLALAKFPEMTKGNQLDILARKALWEHGLNYGHGTGHGVGFCLNVHEGPQNISPGTGSDSKTVIEPGMLISDEPAIYREGEYGIRIENLILCYEDEETEFGKFLKFDTVSLCYIDKSLIDKSLLESREIEWLNKYHTDVFGKLSPHLTADEKEWLREKTSSI